MPIPTRTNGQQPPHVHPAEIDLGSYDFLRGDEDFRHGAFVTLRRDAPIAYFQALARPSESPGRGHWALTTHEDVRFASRHPEIFSSAPTILMADMAPDLAEYLTGMIAMDDPRHQRLRGIVSRAFTPRVLKTIEESIRERARRLVLAMVENHPNGHKVILWCTSANRDEAKFVDPWMFDVRRDPNPHFGYGGGGVHFCLGANLARREITAVFDELHRQIPDIAASAEPAGLVSSFVNGLKQLPVAWTPPR
jgi:cytochrome P450